MTAMFAVALNPHELACMSPVEPTGFTEVIDPRTVRDGATVLDVGVACVGIVVGPVAKYPPNSRTAS
jgi:hypothetical protein